MKTTPHPAERLYPALRAKARAITKNLNDQDDLAQEMALAIVAAGEGHEDVYYLKRADWAARDYRKLAQHRQPISFTDAGLDYNGEREDEDDED